MQSPDERAALVADLIRFGAPLFGAPGPGTGGVEQVLLAGLLAARQDATLQRVLPVVVAKQRHQVDLNALKACAVAEGLEAELGWLLELSGILTDDPGLILASQGLKPASPHRPFPEARNRFEAALAASAPSNTGQRWGLMMAMPDAFFESCLGKHDLAHA